MEQRNFSNTKAFLSIYKKTLLEKESINALFLGSANKNPKAHFVSIEDKNKLLLAIIPPSKSIVLSGHVDSEMLQKLVVYLYSNQLKPIRVFAENNHADLFNKIWTHQSSSQSELEFNEMLFQLDKQQSIDNIDNKSLTVAKTTHVTLITQWIRAFSKEAHEEKTEDDAHKAAVYKIRKNEFYLWMEGGIPVSMVASTRPTSNTISINHVFTPSPFRGRGYATNCVYSLSKLLLKKYKYCLLFTDLSNPTSNGIYKKIGFRPIKAFRQYKFLY